MAFKISDLINLTPIRCVVSIFDDDAHRIISKEGRKILDDNRTVYIIDNYNHKQCIYTDTLKNTMNTKTIF